MNVCWLPPALLLLQACCWPTLGLLLGPLLIPQLDCHYTCSKLVPGSRKKSIHLLNRALENVNLHLRLADVLPAGASWLCRRRRRRQPKLKLTLTPQCIAEDQKKKGLHSMLCAVKVFTWRRQRNFLLKSAKIVASCPPLPLHYVSPAVRLTMWAWQLELLSVALVKLICMCWP